jgi:protein transport protein SEC31
MQRIKAKAPESFKSHVIDTEKRLNILFDNLNNQTLLKSNTVQDMVQLAEAVRDKDYERAMSIHLDLFQNRTEECGNWMVSSYIPTLKIS